MSILRMIKRIMRSMKQRFCRHDFQLMKNGYNDISRVYGGDKLAYKCSKCGKIVWMKY